MLRLALLLLFVAHATTLSAQEPVITEFLARNATNLMDSDRDYSDWFEVHNPRVTTLQLGGYYVTDDPTNLRKWQFPATSVSAGGYVVAFASGKNRAVAGSQLHTNFKLAGAGEYFALVKPDGVTVVSSFAPQYPEQRTDISYGTIGAQLLYFATPTPGAVNRNGAPGFVCQSEIQTPRGIYSAQQAVAITCATPNATIHYTLDSSPPTQASPRYTGPISIRETTVLRARGFAPGLLPSLATTHTFVFIEDTVRQPNRPAGFPTTWGGAPAADYEMDPQVVDDIRYRLAVRSGLADLPTLSISMSVADMFGSNGLYSNTRNTGFAWEREASAEFFDPQTGEEFQLQAGVRIQGGASRNPSSAPKHSLSLRFRDAYSGDLRFRLFKQSRVDRFDSLQLRAMYNNSWIHWSPEQRLRGLLIRDQFMRDALIAMGQRDGGHGRYVCLYLNGLFWGIYDVHERADAAHYANWHGGSAEDYDARNGTSTVNGTSAAWNAMRNAVMARNWTAIQQQLDVDNYIDWLIINEFGGNRDWKTGANWRAAGGGPGRAPWKFYSWDAERVLESPTLLGTSPSSDPADLLQYLRGIPDFVVRFGDRLHRHFDNDGALTPARTAGMLIERTTELWDGIVAESARWGDYRRDVHVRGSAHLYTRDGDWVPERNRLLTSYFPSRSNAVLGRFVSGGLYPTVAAPRFSQHGGKVDAGYLLQILGSGPIYYTLDGTDPRSPGGAVSPSARVYSSAIRLDLSTVVKARILSGSTWSALNEAHFLIESILINEFLARNTTGIRDNHGEREDWIELYNANALPVVVSGMYLTDSEYDPTRWRIPPGYTLLPGGTLLIWADDTPSQGPLHAAFKLKRAGEELLLYDTDGQTLLDRVEFGPQVADVSTGQLYDGQPHRVTFPDPTPGALNAAPGCGSRRYSSLDPTTQTLDLQLTAPPAIGRTVTIQALGGAAGGHRAMLISPFADEIDLGVSPAKLLLSSWLWVLAIQPTGPGGATDFPVAIPNQPSLVGSRAYLQVWGLGNGPWEGSTGLEFTPCR